MSKIDIVRGVYEDFARGDVEAIVGRFADDVSWEHHPTGNRAQDEDVPYMRPRRGREGVGAFFEEAAADFEMTLFRPHTFFENDDQVVSVIEFELTVNETGKTVHDEEIHLWGFDDDGLITSLRHFLDTSKAIEART